jgi:hypothetical protein
LVVDIVAKHATVPDFIKYGEDMNKTQVSKKLIAGHKGMWQEIKKVHNRMTFNQSEMIDVFKQVANRNGKSGVWPRELTDTEIASMAEAMAKRFRVMVRHICQGLVKKRTWALDLFEKKPNGEADSTAGCTQSGTSRKKPAAAPKEPKDHVYAYGYDHLTGKAYREKGKKRDFTDVTVGDNDDGHPVASFTEGGPEIPITAVTNAELRDRRQVALSSRGNLWEGEAKDGERLRVARPSWGLYMH